MTKRRYTGGYYLSWHRRTSKGNLITQNPDGYKHIPIIFPKNYSGKIAEIAQGNDNKVEQKIRADNCLKEDNRHVVLLSTNPIITMVSLKDTSKVEDTRKKHLVSKGSPPLFGGLSILSGFLGVIFSFPFYGLPLSVPIIAIIFTLFLVVLSLFKAIKILKEIKRNLQNKGKGLAILGIILAIIGLIFAVCAVLILLFNGFI